MEARAKLHHIAGGIGVPLAVLFMQIYEWKYGYVEDISNDYVLFEQLGIIPEYVEDFLKEVL